MIRFRNLQMLTLDLNTVIINGAANDILLIRDKCYANHSFMMCKRKI